MITPISAANLQRKGKKSNDQSKRKRVMSVIDQIKMQSECTRVYCIKTIFLNLRFSALSLEIYVTCSDTLITNPKGCV
jgi:hypothetical protein